MGQKFVHVALIFGSAMVMTFGFVNCSQNFSAKRAFLATSKVMGSARAGTQIASSETLPDGQLPPGVDPNPSNPVVPGPTGPVNPGEGVPPVVGTPAYNVPLLPPGPTPLGPTAISFSSPVKYMCSNNTARHQGTTVARTKHEGKTLKIVLEGAVGYPACEIREAGIIDTIVNEKVLAFSDIESHCPAIAIGNYKLYLVQDQASAPFGAVSLIGEIGGGDDAPFTRSIQDGYDVSIVRKAGQRARLVIPEDQEMWVLYRDRKVDVAYDNTECDREASPLMIQLAKPGKTPTLLELSAPLSGVYFDILGAKDGHKKHLISWPTTLSSVDNYFLVLPANNGEVYGIDQLFGDNTLGPDNAFATNGFEALRKYDGRLYSSGVRGFSEVFSQVARDGQINRQDHVYKMLRLWSDRNGNGIAESNELHDLDTKGVESIDLNYDPNFQETDKYHNKIKYKSTVKTRDGRTHAIVDIWFRIID